MNVKKIILLAAVVFAAVNLSACSTIDGWMGNKDNTEPPKPLVAFKPSIKVARMWDVRNGSGTRGAYLDLEPTIRNGRVFTADAKGYITAVNQKNGQRLWQVNTKTDITTGPAVGNGIVVVGTGDAQVIAVNEDSGKVLWKGTASNEVLAKPSISQGKVLVKAIDGKMFALDSSSGKQLWSYDHGAPSLILRASSSPVISGNYVVAGFSDGKLDVLSLATGGLLWQRTIAIPNGGSPVDRMVDIDANPIVSDGVIYVATYQGNIAAVQLNNGSYIWRHKISSYTGLAVGANNVYVSDAQSHVWAFAKDSGGVIWRQNKLEARRVTAPSLMNNAVVVGDAEGYLHWLSPSDGHFLARTRVDSAGIIAAPIARGNNIYVVTNRGDLADYRVA